MNRLQLQLGFGLISIAMFTGIVVPFLANPRLGLAAHTVGVLGGLVLIALGALAGQFNLGARASKTMMWSWVYATYGNWLACLLGGISGASRLTPIAGGATTGSPVMEAVVAALLQSVGVTSLLGSFLAVYALRAARSPALEGSPATREQQLAAARE